MKYLKLFENFEFEDWELVSKSPYELRDILTSEIESFKPDMKLIEKILETGSADINGLTEFGSSPLLASASSGNIRIAKMLLEAGADINIKDHDGRTPLMWGIVYEEYQMVKFLLENGASVHDKDKDLRYPLHWAVHSTDDESFAEILLKYEANPNVEDNQLDTPLMSAVLNERLDTVKVLLKNGANPNVQDENGWTPLQQAVYEGFIKIVKVLLENNADMAIENNRGHDVMYIAKELSSERDREEIISLLKKHNESK
jgi:ankyrin repeat protein